MRTEGNEYYSRDIIAEIEDDCAGASAVRSTAKWREVSVIGTISDSAPEVSPMPQKMRKHKGCPIVFAIPLLKRAGSIRYAVRTDTGTMVANLSP